MRRIETKHQLSAHWHTSSVIRIVYETVYKCRNYSISICLRGTAKRQFKERIYVKTYGLPKHD